MEEVAALSRPYCAPDVRTERVGGQRTPAYGTAFLAVASLVLIVFAWCTYENYMILPDFQAPSGSRWPTSSPPSSG